MLNREHAGMDCVTIHQPLSLINIYYYQPKIKSLYKSGHTGTCFVNYARKNTATVTLFREEIFPMLSL